MSWSIQVAADDAAGLQKELEQQTAMPQELKNFIVTMFDKLPKGLAKRYPEAPPSKRIIIIESSGHVDEWWGQLELKIRTFHCTQPQEGASS